MVVDAEDPGTVSSRAREPQVGKPVVTATVSDPDGGVINDETWQWAKGGEVRRRLDMSGRWH